MVILLETLSLCHIPGLPPSIQLPIQITKAGNETRQNRNFKIQRRERQRERQINNRFYNKTTFLRMHHAFLYISLPFFARPQRENA